MDTGSDMDTDVKAYLLHLKSLKYSQRTIRSYKNEFNRFKKFLSGKNIHRLKDVSIEDLDRYRLTLTDGKFSNETVYTYLTCVRKLFNFLQEHQKLFVNPASGLIIPKLIRKMKPVPTEDEVYRLLSQPDVTTGIGIRDRAMMETLYSTGARVNELVCMNTCDLDLKNGHVKVLGKGNKERVVPLGRQAVFWTRQYLKDVRKNFLKNKPDEPALWLGCCGRRIHLLMIERAVSGYGKKAGIALNITPHSLRRAVATHMLNRGAHPVEIQMLLGHSSLQTLGKYLKVSIKDIIKTHSKGRPGK